MSNWWFQFLNCPSLALGKGSLIFATVLFKWFELKPQPISWIYGIKLEMTYSEEALTKRSMCFGCSPCEI